MSRENINEKYRFDENFKPVSKEVLLKNIKQFLENETNDDSWRKELSERVDNDDFIELMRIFESIVHTKWDGGHKGRDIPVEFNLNNLSKNEKFPFITPLPRISDEWYDEPDKFLTAKFIKDYASHISCLSEALASVTRELGMLAGRSMELESKNEE